MLAMKFGNKMNKPHVLAIPKKGKIRDHIIVRCKLLCSTSRSSMGTAENRRTAPSAVSMRNQQGCCIDF
jgi:hypothetical protein